MKNELNRKQILDLFESQLLGGYEAHCEQHQIQLDYKGLITYIIDQDLINPQIIQKYTVMKAFRARSIEQRGAKTQIVEELADRFNLSTRTIWSIIKQDTK